MSSFLPASRIEAFQVTVTAGTTKSAAVETSTTFLPAVLSTLELDIPSGHSGLTGIRFLVAHSQVIPHTSGAWIVGDDDRFRWDLLDYIDNGQWSVSCYNLDRFDHTFYIHYLLNDVPQSLGVPPVEPVATPVLV